MKTNFFIVLLALTLTSVSKSLAQTDIISTFNSTHSGRSVSLILSKTFGEKNELGLGLRFNINKLAQVDDQNNIFKKRLYATEFAQYWGGELFYNRYFINKWTCVKPFIFYDLQISHSTTRSSLYIPKVESLNYGTLYQLEVVYFGPFTWIEQCVGVGYKIKVTENFYLFQKIGYGITFILGKDEKLPATYDKFEWEFGGIIQVGLLYRIKD